MAIILSKDKLENQEQEVYFNFMGSLKSPVTKKIYETNIKYYMDATDGITCKDVKQMSDINQNQISDLENKLNQVSIR
jgi:hypothetical protein